jgi:adenylyltransferase/sulfurtransferase
MLLPQIGQAGQRRLGSAHVLLVGCGALGTATADQLVRAGVGRLTVIDRDIVELTNLQRQTLYTESDAAEGTPKSVAAVQRLSTINTSVKLTPVVTDVHAGNVEDFLKNHPDVILDGTDNVQTRYLINDASVKHGVPWVYGAAVATEGRIMAIRPGVGPCLRCVFPTPPAPHELPTCDTAGVLGMGATIVGAWQAIQALQLILGADAGPTLLRLDFWRPRVHVVSLDQARRADCPCCGQHRFEYLDAATSDSTVSLCGRNTVQVRPSRASQLDLEDLVRKLNGAGTTQRTRFYLRCQLTDPPHVTLTVFPDGRALIEGIPDINRAKSIYARFVGA